MKIKAAIAGAALLALVGGVLIATGGDLWPERHTDGWGPLGSYGTAGMGFGGQGPTWSVGVPLCLARGQEPAVLDGTVTAMNTYGDGFRVLGAVVRQGVPDQGFGVIGSVDGFPPSAQFSGGLPSKGYAVTSRCDSANLSARHTELDVGITKTGAGGGGWNGLEVGYTVGWRHHVLSIESMVAICGPAVPKEPVDLCAGTDGA